MSPVADANGTGSVTVTVTDGLGATGATTFTLTVTAVNDAPTISDIANQTTDEDTAKVVNYLIADIDSALNCASAITVTSTNTTLLPVVNAVKSGTSPACVLTLNPAANQNGSSTITVTVSDGSLT